MEHNTNYNPYEGSPNPQGNPPYGYPVYKPTNGLELASLILGAVSLISCSCLYISIPVGALAIIFALLSRGGKMTFDTKARTGLILGIIGIVITIVFYAFSFYIAIQEYGSFEALLRESCEMAGYDYDALFGDLFQ